jgi:hypothetical protein
MYCKICGDERNVAYRPAARQSLCDSCSADTPAKIGRVNFDRWYWDGRAGEVCESTKRDFYEDYLRSNHTFDQYLVVTLG